MDSNGGRQGGANSEGFNERAQKVNFKNGRGGNISSSSTTTTIAA